MKYQELQIERQLLRNNTDITSLNLLQRNSITHLKETQENNHIFYHSLDQHHKALRIIIFSLLTKIYTGYSLLNARRLQTLKYIVYNAPLNAEITESRGIERKQLLKLFAEKINSLVIDSGVQISLCNLINSSAFFQEILLLAFQQAISKWLNQQNNEQAQVEKQENKFQQKSCLNFMESHFDLYFQILTLSDLNVVQGQNQILLYKVNQHIYKKSNKNIEISSASSSSVKESNSKENKAFFTLESIKMNETSKLQEMSPFHFSPNHKNSPNRSDRSIKKSLVESSAQKKRRKKKQEESGGFFSLFCCCN